MNPLSKQTLFTIQLTYIHPCLSFSLTFDFIEGLSHVVDVIHIEQIVEINIKTNGSDRKIKISCYNVNT